MNGSVLSPMSVGLSVFQVHGGQEGKMILELDAFGINRASHGSLKWEVLMEVRSSRWTRDRVLQQATSSRVIMHKGVGRIGVLCQNPRLPPVGLLPTPLCQSKGDVHP